MTESELTTWLQSWIADATGADTVDPSVPLDNLGLSSRDVVVLSGELERLLDIKLDPTVAYQYPTVEALAHGLLSPTAGSAQSLSTFGSASTARRSAGVGSGDIAIVGRAGRFPGAANVDEFWDMLVAGQSVTGPLPEGRWSEYSQDPVMSAKMREQNVQGGYLDDIRSFDNEFFGLSPLRRRIWTRNSASCWSWHGRRSKMRTFPRMSCAASPSASSSARPRTTMACSSLRTRHLRTRTR